jgi:hypothetical protein
MSEIGVQSIFTANSKKALARVVGFFARLRRANGPRDRRSLAIADHPRGPFQYLPRLSVAAG